MYRTNLSGAWLDMYIAVSLAGWLPSSKREKTNLSGALLVGWMAGSLAGLAWLPSCNVGGKRCEVVSNTLRRIGGSIENCRAQSDWCGQQEFIGASFLFKLRDPKIESLSLT